MINRLNRSFISNQTSRFGDDVASTGQTGNCAENILTALFQGKASQKCFQSGLILEVQHFLQLRDLFVGQADAIDNSTEEIDAAEIDLKIRNAEALESFDSD